MRLLRQQGEVGSYRVFWGEVHCSLDSVSTHLTVINNQSVPVGRTAFPESGRHFHFSFFLASKAREA
jgi:hypothetical protein